MSELTRCEDCGELSDAMLHCCGEDIDIEEDYPELREGKSLISEYIDEQRRHLENGPAYTASTPLRSLPPDMLDIISEYLDDGPAVISSIGLREWWVGGLLHREDGPAIEGGIVLTDRPWIIEQKENGG